MYMFCHSPSGILGVVEEGHAADVAVLSPAVVATFQCVAVLFVSKSRTLNKLRHCLFVFIRLVLVKRSAIGAEQSRNLK